MQKWFILSLVIAIIIGVFAISNSEVVEIDFIFASFEVSQAIVIFISALLGAIIVVIIDFIRVWKLKRQVKDLDKKLTQRGNENDSLLELIENKNKEIDSLNNMINMEEKDDLEEDRVDN